MIEVEKVYEVDMTPEMAKKWQSEYAYSKQRPLKPKAVKLYAESMRSGLWLPGTQLKLARLRNSLSKELVDGQHREAAVVASDTTQRFSVAEYVCDTEDEVATLYFKTDRGEARTTRDLMVAAGLSELTGINGNNLDGFASAVKYMRTDFLRSGRSVKYGVTDEDVIEGVKKYKQAAWLHLLTCGNAGNRETRKMRRASIFALGIVTFHYASKKYGEEKVVEFWHGVTYDDGLKMNDPRKEAYRHIQMTRIGATAGTVIHKNSEIINADYQARYVAQCWNAWVEERQLKHIKNPDPRSPIKILGTPWLGEKKVDTVQDASQSLRFSQLPPAKARGSILEAEANAAPEAA